MPDKHLKLSNEDAKSTPKARGKRLKSLRKMADLSRREVENKYRISSGTLRGWEEGRHGGLTEKGAKRVLVGLRQEGIQCSLGWLLHGKGTGPQALDRLYSHVREELAPEYVESAAHAQDENSIVNAELQLFCKLNKDAIDMVVVDDGMEPLYSKNDIVAGCRRYNGDIAATVGRPCIVETQRGEILLRQVRPGSKPGYYTLVCININTNMPALVLYDVELLSAAPVIWHRKKES